MPSLSNRTNTLSFSFLFFDKSERIRCVLVLISQNHHLNRVANSVSNQSRKGRSSPT
jgi:hypothetical protein